MWVVACVLLALDIGVATPESDGAHGMVPGAVVQVNLVFVVVFGTTPGLALVILGTRLAKGAHLAELGVLAGAIVIVPLALGIGFDIPFSVRHLDAFVAKVIALGLMLVPTTLLVQVVTEARGPVRSSLLEQARRRASALTLAAPAVLVCVALGLRWAGVSGTSDDASPLWLRSNKTLILQATESPPDRVARDELRRRGSAATLDVVKTLASFAPTGPDDDTDEGRRIEPLMGLLGDLGGPAAMSELHRWLTREDAARGARAMAALALGRAHDHASTPAIVRLLDPPDPAGPGHDNGRIRVIEALRIMPAPEATGSVYAALLRQGPKAEGSYGGIMTLSSFGTEEAKEDIGHLREAWGEAFPIRNADWLRENTSLGDRRRP